MFCLNKVILIGTVGSQSKTQYISKGFSKYSFSLATDYLSKLPDGKEVTMTNWHDIVVYGKLSEYASLYVKTGDYICVEGSLKSRYITSESGFRYKYCEIEGEKISIISHNQKQENTNKELKPKNLEEEIGSAIPGFDIENIPASKLAADTLETLPF